LAWSKDIVDARKYLVDKAVLEGKKVDLDAELDCLVRIIRGRLSEKQVWAGVQAIASKLLEKLAICGRAAKALFGTS
jgi:hypothetical protein